MRAELLWILALYLVCTPAVGRADTAPARLAVLELRDAFVLRQADAAGAQSGVAAQVTLDRVVMRDNAQDEVVGRELPVAAALPAPTAVCASPPCD